MYHKIPNTNVFHILCYFSAIKAKKKRMVEAGIVEEIHESESEEQMEVENTTWETDPTKLTYVKI